MAKPQQTNVAGAILISRITSNRYTFTTTPCFGASSNSSVLGTLSALTLRSRTRSFCPGCGTDFQTISDKLDEAECGSVAEDAAPGGCGVKLIFAPGLRERSLRKSHPDQLEVIPA